MKKAVLFLIGILFLSGCAKSPEKQLEELGYAPELIPIILEMDEEHQALFFEAAGCSTPAGYPVSQCLS